MPVNDLTKPKTGKQLVMLLKETGFIGFWKDRDDILDSTQFSEILRDRANHRGRNNHACT